MPPMVPPRPGYVSARTINTIATITTRAATMRTRIRKAVASDSVLENVDRRVDDHPHDVDEVPVDPRHFHALVVLGRVVAAERADVDDRQRAQADEHVGAVQAGERVEDGGL